MNCHGLNNLTHQLQNIQSSQQEWYSPIVCKGYTNIDPDLLTEIDITQPIPTVTKSEPLSSIQFRNSYFKFDPTQFKDVSASKDIDKFLVSKARYRKYWSIGTRLFDVTYLHCRYWA